MVVINMQHRFIYIHVFAIPTIYMPFVQRIFKSESPSVFLLDITHPMWYYFENLNIYFALVPLSLFN